MNVLSMHVDYVLQPGEPDKERYMLQIGNDNHIHFIETMKDDWAELLKTLTHLNKVQGKSRFTMGKGNITRVQFKIK